MISFIGVDWDNISLGDFIEQLRYVNNYINTYLHNIESFKCFQTTHGWHLKFFLKTPVPLLCNLKARACMFDDKSRIFLSLLKFDLSRDIRDFDVLFTEKNGRQEKDKTKEIQGILEVIQKNQELQTKDLIDILIQQKHIVLRREIVFFKVKITWHSIYIRLPKLIKKWEVVLK